MASASDRQSPPQESAADLIERLVTAITTQSGPIADRIERSIGRFSGTGEDVAEWLTNFERRCTVENVQPHSMIANLLSGNAMRIYHMLTVSEVIQWPVVKARLLAQYGLARHLAHQQFKARKLGPAEPVEVYAEDLQRLAARLNVESEHMIFKAQFYDGLSQEDFSWAVTRPNAYTDDFMKILAEVGERVSARQSLLMRNITRSAAGAADGSGGCHRCGGDHKVRACPRPRSRVRTSRSRARRPPVPKSSVTCYSCQKTGHYARECPSAAAVLQPVQPVTALRQAEAAPHAQASFLQGDVSGGATSPSMETS